MEIGLVDTEQVKHVFLYKIFEKHFPYYLSIGMSYDDFWKKDVCLVKAYRKAFELKEKREAEKKRWELWEQGLYVYDAICDVAPVLRAFSKTKKPLPYPSEPFKREKKKIEEEENAEQVDKEEKAKRELELYRTQIFFKNWAKSTEKHFKEESK